jgi:hypothetical protein
MPKGITVANPATEQAVAELAKSAEKKLPLSASEHTAIAKRLLPMIENMQRIKSMVDRCYAASSPAASAVKTVALWMARLQSELNNRYIQENRKEFGGSVYYPSTAGTASVEEPEEEAAPAPPPPPPPKPAPPKPKVVNKKVDPPPPPPVVEDDGPPEVDDEGPPPSDEDPGMDPDEGWGNGGENEE